jgi:diguanylate cyclase (GGDEF)-like protein
MPIWKDAAFAGYRIRRKVSLALLFSSFIPLLIMIYVLHAYIVPLLGRERLVLVALQGLILFTGLLMAAGAYLIWDLANAVARTARLVADSGAVPGQEEPTDEIHLLTNSVSSLVGTIERQTGELNQFSIRLETAYKELEQTNAKLKKLSFEDELTGLYNRRFLSVRMSEELSRFRRFNHPASIILLDVDDFKPINDELGHAVGDETLRDIAQILLKHSREINVICRYGGDEFAVLLVETARAGARNYAERIRQAVADHPFSHGRTVTVSLGIASLPEDVASSMEDLLRVADEALYTAKRLGKNRVAEYTAAPADERVG